MQKGLTYPLAAVKSSADGLLKALPAAPAEKTGWPWTEETPTSVYNVRAHWPKITIVTPSYNQDEFLEQTIRSVLLQNYPNLEYIIIDGGSTDHSKKILEKYSPWISYWQSEKDQGQGQAINLGFSLASGDYYAWINSDDYYLENVFFEVISKFLSTRTEFVYGYGYSYHQDKDWFELNDLLPVLDLFIQIPGIVQPSTFWKSTIHKPIWEEMHCALDFELWMRLVKGKKRRLIKKPLSVANVHEDAKTSDPRMLAKWAEDEKRMWSADGHGPVPHWGKVNYINRIRIRLYRLFAGKK